MIGTSDNTEKRKCFHCKKPGHLKKNCFLLKREKRNAGSQAQGGAPIADLAEASNVDDEDEVLSITNSSSGLNWILDSGCLFHMCHIKDWFESFKYEHSDSVLLGDDHTCAIIGIGNVKIKMHDGVVRILSSVRFIPDLRRNLISLGTLDKMGYKYGSENGVMKVFKGDIPVIKANLRNGLYHLQGEVVNGLSGVVYTVPMNDDKTQLWHNRLAHISERGLRS